MKNAIIQFLLPSNLKLIGSREYLVSSTASWLKQWIVLPHDKPRPKVAWIPTLVTKFRFHFLRITFLYLEMSKIIQNNHIWEFSKHLLTSSAENLKIRVKNVWLSSNVFWMNDQSLSISDLSNKCLSSTVYFIFLTNSTMLAGGIKRNKL